MNTLSIIIVNWNTRGLLRECLDSIKKNRPLFAYETIVVDNASEDDSVAAIKNEYPDTHVIENQVNHGFAAANNQGAKIAAATWLLFLNSDTRVHPDTLAGAVSFMTQHAEAGVMGCRTLNSNGSLQASAFTFPGKLRLFAYVSGLNRFFKLSRFTDHSTLRTPDYVQGSFLIIKKEIFEKCGGFDEHFFLYAEEIDLCQRVKASGLKIYYSPDISITHHGGGSGKNSLACLGHFIKSSIVLYRKYRPPLEEKKLRKTLKNALRLRLFGELVFSPLEYRKRKKGIQSLLHELLVVNAIRPSEHE